MTKRAVVAVLLVGLIVSACSENPLSDVGHLTNDWIGEPAQHTAPVGSTTVPAPTYRSSTEVTWVNDALSVDPSLPEETLAQVWGRHESGDKYVQASRVEIAGVLPGIEFPERLPDDVRFLSSQLLFDGDGTLANDFVAAFGLWTAEPYTVSRSIGQYGILWVTYPDPDRSGCDRFSNRDITSCEMVLFEGATRWRLESGDDQRLVWVEEGYQYELFHRKQISPEMALELASRTVPLETIEVPGGGAAGLAPRRAVGPRLYRGRNIYELGELGRRTA